MSTPTENSLATDDRPPRPSKPPGAAAPAPPGAAAARPSAGQPAPKDRVSAAYKDLLQEIVEKKKQAVEVRRLPQDRKRSDVVKAVLAVVLPPIAAALWIFQPFAPPPPTTPPPPDESGAWRMALTDAALRVREWRDSAGRLPGDLGTAGVALSGVTFERTGPESFSLRTVTREGPVTVWMEGRTLGLGARAPASSPPVTGAAGPAGGSP